MAIKVFLQVKTATISAKGVWASRPPILPIKEVIPDIVLNSSGRNHTERIFRIQTNTTDTPIPTRSLPRKDTVTVGAKPKRIDPTPASRVPAVTVFLAPRVSARIPAGICISI